MTSYDNLPSHSQSLAQDNLLSVHRGLTSKPQNSLADFKIRSTDYGLEIQLSQHRLREGAVFTSKPKKAEESELSLLMVAVTVLLVGGTTALTQSKAFGTLVAIAIPIFWKIANPQEDLTRSRTATLRFVNTPNNQTLLSVTSVPTPRFPNLRPHLYSDATPSEVSTVHFSNLPIELVSASTYVVGGQLMLTLRTRVAPGKSNLRITGTRQEIRWLHARISKWAEATLPNPIV